VDTAIERGLGEKFDQRGGQADAAPGGESEPPYLVQRRQPGDQGGRDARRSPEQSPPQSVGIGGQHRGGELFGVGRDRWAHES
jgi:hypothetical protein